MRTRSVALLLVATALAASTFVACSKDEKKPEKTASAEEKKKSASVEGDDEAKPEAKKKKKKKAEEADDDQSDEKKPKADEKAEKTAEKSDDDESAVPGKRTAMPSKKEFDDTSDAKLDGLDATACQARVVREWIRITCRTKNPSGGTPVDIKVVKGSVPGTSAVALGTTPNVVTSLVTPYEPGTDLEATFYWTDKAQTLTLKWPLKKKMPEPLGAFTASTEKGKTQAAAQDDRLCDCEKSLKQPKKFCGEKDIANPDCDYSFRNDCKKLVSCNSGEIMPICPFGTALSGPGLNHCLKLCKGATDKSCPGKQFCAEMGDKWVCSYDHGD